MGVGGKLGRYELREPLGKGGMAAVYRAYDPVIDREIAIKILPPELAKDETFRQRFLEEARAIARVEHRNLVRIYTVGQEGSASFYAMELVEGRSLSQALHVRGKLSVAEALAVFQQLLAGVEAMHAAGIVHRDIKPSNLMLENSGRAVLMDFGLARRTERQSLTAAGSVLGTPEYMSPEQAKGKTADARSDLYSAGVVLFEMLTGRPPFLGKDAVGTLRQHVESPTPILSELCPEAGVELTQITQKLLAKRPEERYSHAAQVVADISALDAARQKPEPVVQALVASIVGAAEKGTRAMTRRTPVARATTPPASGTAGEPAPMAFGERLRTWVAVTSAVVAVLALAVAVLAVATSRPSAPPLPPTTATTQLAGADIEWTVTLWNDTQFDARLMEVSTTPNGRTVWVFRRYGGQVQRCPDGTIKSMEPKKGGETP